MLSLLPPILTMIHLCIMLYAYRIPLGYRALRSSSSGEVLNCCPFRLECTGCGV